MNTAETVVSVYTVGYTWPYTTYGNLNTLIHATISK